MRGSPEHEVEAWLATVAASGQSTVQSLPTATIVPQRGDSSANRAADFLSHLVERGRPVELRTGKVIGEGGMGLVHEAEQVALGRVVAVKTVKPGRKGPLAASDLLREAWVTGALEHPNVVPVHHLEIDDDLMPLLILKRVDGVEWSALARDGAEIQRRFGATDVLAWNLGIFGQVLNALRFAHARGVIHRDLKPSNVMIGNFGEVYLLDWGIALSLRDDGTGRFPLVSEARDLAGTPSYMAPEMLLHEDAPPLSERTDVYLAGSVLFELIAGTPPHKGTSAVEIITSIITSKPALPSDAPAELAQICMRAMHQDPAQRYESIEALQLAIQGYLEHRGSSRLTAGARLRLTELVALASHHRPEQREEIYRQLAICRFAFHDALAAWRDNADARDGLARATIAVAEYELACGDPRAAVTLLNELDDKPALLAQARAAVEQQAARHDKLEQLGRDANPDLHPRTRRAMFAITSAFVVLPLLAGVRSDMGLENHLQQVVWAVLCCVVVNVLWLVVRRKSGMWSHINRRMFALAQWIFFCQAILAISTWQMGLKVADDQTYNLFLWGAITGSFSFLIDLRLLPISVGYFTALFVAGRWPEYRMFAVSGGNLGLALTIIWRWHPMRKSAEEARP